jgi:tRNA threonylcarbamoyladenosine modification (KEOPS) complex  Pcc1 subunit
MRKNSSSFEIQLPNKSSKYIIAALTGEEVVISGNKIEIFTKSLKELRSRWNTVMRTIEVSHSVLEKIEERI